MDKDDEFTQVQRKLKSKKLEIGRHQQQKEKSIKSMTTLKRRTSYKL